jgi:hypothetical protein
VREKVGEPSGRIGELVLPEDGYSDERHDGEDCSDGFCGNHVAIIASDFPLLG